MHEVNILVTYATLLQSQCPSERILNLKIYYRKHVNELNLNRDMKLNMHTSRRRTEAIPAFPLQCGTSTP